MIDKDQYQFIKEHPAFKQLPVDTLDKLATEIHFRKIPKGQIIFFEGDRRDRLFLIYKGYVRIEQYDQTDTFSYIDYIKEGDVFPVGGLFYEKYYHHTASSSNPVQG